METDEDTVVDELIELLLSVLLQAPGEIGWQDSDCLQQEVGEYREGGLGKFNILLLVVLAFDFILVVTVSVLLELLVELLSVMR